MRQFKYFNPAVSAQFFELAALCRAGETFGLRDLPSISEMLACVSTVTPSYLIADLHWNLTIASAAIRDSLLAYPAAARESCLRGLIRIEAMPTVLEAEFERSLYRMGWDGKPHPKYGPPTARADHPGAWREYVAWVRANGAGR